MASKSFSKKCFTLVPKLNCHGEKFFTARDFSRTGKEMPKVTPKGNTGSAKGKGKGAQVFQLINLI